MEQVTMPTLEGIKRLVEPLHVRLQQIEDSLQRLPKMAQPLKYYRNNDIKRLFGFSNNTIIKYRDNGTLPFTKFGEVYLYEAKVIDKILEDNKVNFQLGGLWKKS
jgi:hypothetical protein